MIIIRALIFMILFCIISYLPSQAQILNADRFGSNVDSTNRFKAVFDFGMRLNKQQDLLVSFDTKLDLSYWFKNNSIISVSRFNLFRSGSDNLINGGYSHLRLRLMRHKWIHPEIFSQIQLDGIRGMNSRFLVGSNARMRLVEYDNGRLDIGLGAMYEYEKWDYSGVPDTVLILDETPIQNRYIKMNSYISYYQKVGKAMELQSMIYFQTRPDSYFIAPRISSDIALTFTITKHVRFTVKYNLFYDAAPPVPINKLFYNMVNQITVTW